MYNYNLSEIDECFESGTKGRISNRLSSKQWNEWSALQISHNDSSSYVQGKHDL